MLWEHVGKRAEEMRRLVFLLTTIALVLVLASGVALAVDRIGTNGPDTLRGTNGADNLLGKGGNDALFGLTGRDNMLGGEGKDWVLGGNEQRPLGGDKNLVGGSRQRWSSERGRRGQRAWWIRQRLCNR